MYPCIKLCNFYMSSLKLLSNFHQTSHGTFCRNDVDNLFKYFCAIEQNGGHAHNGKTRKNLLQNKERPNLGIQHWGLRVS